jgi:hypothetical protein
MIFFNNQLMPTTGSATLYMVSNPVAFTRYEDHEAAIFIQLHELIERAFAEGEDPVTLIESYLETVYTGGNTTNEIANFLMQSDKMTLAMWTLKESWSNLDESIPGDSLMYGGIEKKEAIQLYAEITLRTYLEVLTGVESV